MIVGTAGHIDHGKSALVTALTGRPTDRLAEERRRGITIELGFAPLDLGAGRTAAMVDVPGHEDFVRTMVAGASGLDAALLVVAADEGPMPQTREHLRVLEHLGVRRGVAVLSKADLVDAEWLDLVRQELRELLAQSPVSFGEPLAVSARTGAGLDTLRERLAELWAERAPRDAADLFRLPVDRAFSVPGTGTVVTGTAWSGGVAPGDYVRILPAGVRARVRNVECFGAAVARSAPGARIALGLAGVGRREAGRGSTVVTDAAPWSAATRLELALRLDPGARPLASGARVRVHLGTAEAIGRVHLRRPIEPGGESVGWVRLDAPVVARAGDRVVLRSWSPVTTIGGGRVLDPDPGPARLRAEEPGGAAEDRLVSLVARRVEGVVSAALPLLTGLPPAEAERLAECCEALVLQGDRWFERERLEAVGAAALEALERHHAARAAEPGMPLATLRRGLRAPAPLVDAAVTALAAGGAIVLEGGLARRAGFAPRVAGGAELLDALVAAIDAGGLAPPDPEELAARFPGTDLPAALRLAAHGGRIEMVGPRAVSRAALDRFVQVLEDLGAADEIAPAALRERLGLSRKYLIPLLEWADRAGVTWRDGDVRRLRRRASA